MPETHISERDADSVVAKRVAILLGQLAHRRITQTFQHIGPRYTGIVVGSRSTYPPAIDMGMPLVTRTAVRDIIRHVPKVRGRVPWGPDQYIFGLESALSGIDVVVGHGATAMYSYQAAKYCQREGIPLVLQELGLIPLRGVRGRLYPCRSKALSVAGRIVAVTERARIVLRLEGVPDEKIRVIPYGVDTDFFYPRARQPGMREQLGFSEDHILVLYVGRIAWGKGVYDLVYAAKLLSEDPEVANHRIGFAFIGDGEESAGIREAIDYLNLKDVCRLVGGIRYDQMPAVYAAADIVAVPSIPARLQMEQWCLVLSEAMAMGIPTIAACCGGMPEVVGDAGILVHPQDPLTLSQAIKRLVLSADLRQELSEAGLARVRERFDSRVVGSLWADVLDEALSHGQC